MRPDGGQKNLSTLLFLQEKLSRLKCIAKIPNAINETISGCFKRKPIAPKRAAKNNKTAISAKISLKKSSFNPP